MTIKINNEKLKVAIDVLSEAVEVKGFYYVGEVRVECYRNMIIKGIENAIEIPVEYAPVLALKLLLEYERTRNAAEVLAKKFQEGVWEGI
jgi:hypothetical protein